LFTIRSCLSGKSPRVRRLAALAAAALLVSGCGSTATKQAEDVHSVAAEGALLAHDAAEGSTTSTFTRVHGRALRDLATKVAEEPKNRFVGAVAGIVASQLDALADHPGDRVRADRVQRVLERAAKAMGDLAKAK
jgi:hypothetical protein